MLGSRVNPHRPRLLLCTEHCILDSASGAALSALEALSPLAQRDWDISVLCGPLMDGQARPPTGQHVQTLRPDHDLLTVHASSVLGLPVRVVRTGTDLPPSDTPALVPALAHLLDHTLRTRRPDLLLTYGGGVMGRTVLKLARAHAIPTAFWLRNPYYQRKDLFEDVTADCIVPSMFAARHYREGLGLQCDLLYPAIRRDRVHCPVRRPRYLTYVSPLPEKGVFFFARVISELARRRPDIEVLIVEGRGSLDWFARTGLDVLSQPSVRTLPRTDDPREFLAVTRVLAMPSVWPETFGRTAVEALINAIPVVASDRGGLPEIFASPSDSGGLLLPIASRITHDKPILATVGEASHWVHTIERLWDEDDFYHRLSAAGPASAARFDPETLTDRLDALLRSKLSPAPHAAQPHIDLVGLLTAAGVTDAPAALAPWAELPHDAERLLAWPSGGPA